MGTAPRVIVRSSREDLATAVREDLVALGGGDVDVPADKDTCIEQLIRHPDAILVVDWELGSEEVNQILGAIRGHFRVETRPVLLVIPEINDNVIATGAEYGVSQIHSGPIAADTIKECLAALIQEDSTTRAIKEVMLKVAVTREKGDWAIATPLLMELWDKNAGNDRVAVELAENLIYESSWEQAISLLVPFIATDPPLIRALHLLGRCYMHMGNHDKAIELLERAKIINPHNVDRLIDLGHAFINADQLDAASAQFEEALGLDGERKEAKEGKGQVMLMNGDVNEALTLLKSVSGPRELASIFNTSAVLSIRAGRFDQGMQLYRSALAALGRNDKIAARLLFNMGMGYERMHKAEKALTCYTKSLELDPMYVKAARHKEVAEKAVAAGGGKAPAPDGGEAPFDEEDFAGRGGAKKKNALLPDEPLHDHVDFDDDADEDKSS